jgi:hypothetical protein
VVQHELVDDGWATLMRTVVLYAHSAMDRITYHDCTIFLDSSIMTFIASNFMTKDSCA